MHVQQKHSKSSFVNIFWCIFFCHLVEASQMCSSSKTELNHTQKNLTSEKGFSQRCLRTVVLKPLHEVLPALHILYVSLSDTPTSGLAGSPNELIRWITCDWWGRNTKCAGLGVLQDRFENHCLRRTISASPRTLYILKNKSSLLAWFHEEPQKKSMEPFHCTKWLNRNCYLDY